MKPTKLSDALNNLDSFVKNLEQEIEKVIEKNQEYIALIESIKLLNLDRANLANQIEAERQKNAKIAKTTKKVAQKLIIITQEVKNLKEYKKTN